MIYVVYMKQGIMKVTSKGVAKREGYLIVNQFDNFYSAVEWIHTINN